MAREVAQIRRRQFVYKGKTVERFQVRWTSSDRRRLSRIVTSRRAAELLKEKIRLQWLLSTQHVTDSDLGGNLIEGTDAIRGYLGLSFHAFRYLLYERSLPVFRISRFLYALKTDLDEYMKERGNVPTTETA